MDDSIVYLLVGNIGTGKSTTAQVFAAVNPNIALINDDALAQTLFPQFDYGQIWLDAQRVLFLRRAILGVLDAAVESKLPVVLDAPFMSRISRAMVVDTVAKRADIYCVVHKNDNALENRLREPRGETEETWRKVFARLHNEFEEPSFNEGFSDILYYRNFHRVVLEAF
jgi:predicted kinase